MRDYCVNCCQWDPAEERCRMADMEEYDPEGFLEMCKQCREDIPDNK